MGPKLAVEWGETQISDKQLIFKPDTSSRKKDDCCGFIAAIFIKKTETSLSGAFPMGCNRASNHGVLLETLEPITV
jgi:hypothetical protein